MPPEAEFEVCLRKIKCGFNLLVRVHNYIHILSSWSVLFMFTLWCTVCLTVLLLCAMYENVFILTGGAQWKD